ncbi:MAG: hypothetical protein JW797_00830 [Bradymonadales bacterium]|nr:hypothetical protein [Bradymonadales bacterium]
MATAVLIGSLIAIQGIYNRVAAAHQEKTAGPLAMGGEPDSPDSEQNENPTSTARSARGEEVTEPPMVADRKDRPGWD